MYWWVDEVSALVLIITFMIDFGLIYVVALIYAVASCIFCAPFTVFDLIDLSITRFVVWLVWIMRCVRKRKAGDFWMIIPYVKSMNMSSKSSYLPHLEDLLHT